ncbi:hypothetical protein SAMN02927916_2306 [Flavobacterium anhuiense]|uniref:Nucleotidyltransferase n=1 Tax=Flavobacterium anhuiense TaxID=459526 RepID=A0ABY0LQA6_9FLAO|nr:hypothetical protein [Flavobacterium anhuiense]SCY49761.1 hypothetical protein SAMN02927916_2306 [Flavobacterium anhuiense]
MNFFQKWLSKKDKKTELWKNQSYIKDLEILLTLIKRYEIDGNFKAIEDVIDVLRRKDFVDYEFSNLEFYINGNMVGTLPDDVDLNYCIVKFDNKVALTNPIEKNIDSLHIYTLDLKIELYKSRKNKQDPKYSSWHLDKERNPENCKYTHPYYHFQFGGKKLEYLEPNLGVLSSPRIPHPPMDIILAFHFIINNFYNNKSFKFVKKILNDHDYQTILSNSQKRIWDEYFKAFQAKNTHEDYNFSKVFPLYVN